MLALVLTPAFAKKQGSGRKAMRSDLDSAVRNGNLNEQERAKYDAAMKVLDGARGKKKSGETVDRTAMRQAMKDLQQISRSENLKPEDREKLAKSMHAKGRRAK
ncbi:MAG: hypothetical protein NTV52_11930 [Acidobacteria bacterium]|nr:hypothetical protein [Acidobacteriota bacterium]